MEMLQSVHNNFQMIRNFNNMNKLVCCLFLVVSFAIPEKAMAGYDCQVQPITISVTDATGLPVSKGSVRLDFTEQSLDFGFPRYDDGTSIPIPMAVWKGHTVGTETLPLNQKGQAHFSGRSFKTKSLRHRNLRLQASWLGDEVGESIDMHQKRIHRAEEATFDCRQSFPENIKLTVKTLVVPAY